ncbi:Mrp/NBP35 family ATP-binding protein [Polymorphobacter fuscus]|uniref:Iron-sulfur cluster carrier protein n=1 Tax=Sandarakinorhabdus fusca TaxID=1439888 RepID=A0A7C9GR48_9SPHN|nr:Mrp/NBP35 family ATP-binding protein [Polymorphobacter fuscus]KAB7644965.1 Mrp/NBP35 family ATP-binding protein [Polymorphobacter fuscus]MQT18253.1 P-loop NTPase [Polymorphobacter fuscus]NJC09577.1 ATP-binding protein involved in chromosome partitioning [Polymorphobacter fuscus]
MTVKDDVAAALRGVADPLRQGAGDAAGDIVTSGRAAGIVVKADGSVGLVLSVDGLDRTAAERLQASVEAVVNRVPGVTAARIILTADRASAPAATARPVATTVPGIRKIVAVASGKGGVGKSTVAANLAIALARAGNSVGLLDADIYGPSVPTLLGISGRARIDDGKLQPVAVHGIKALSMGMMTDPTKAVIWRGPMASSAMLQMVEKADWGALDVLVIDLPPGTGDIQLTMAQKLKPDGAVIVSTPQDLALIDARRAVAMFAEVGVPVLGVVENMSGYVCPHCGEASDPFGHGGAEAEALAMGVPFLGRIPLDIALRRSSDAGAPATGANAAVFAAVAAAVGGRVGL